MTAAPLFPDRTTLPWQQQHANADALVATVPGSGFARPEAIDLLHRVLCPASLDWGYLVIGKTGSSAVLMAMFELTFGVPLTVRADDPLNEDAIGHRLTEAGVLRALISIPDAVPHLGRMLRFSSLRHPARRALSSFLYLCKANESGITQFLRERLQMSILCGFDWNRDARSPDGFLRFLDFLLLAQDSAQGIALDLHLQRQIDILHPDVFRPDLCLRLETLQSDLGSIANRLGRPAPAPTRRANAQDSYDPAAFLDHQSVRDRIERLFAPEWALFGYDPDFRAPPGPMTLPSLRERPAP